MNDVSSINAEAMGDLVSAMNRAHGALTSDLDRLRGRMRSWGLPLHALDDVGRIGDWIEEQVPGLERRRNMAEALTGDRPAATMVQVDEPLRFDTPEEAEEFGRELARQIDDGTIDAGTFDQLFAEFESYVRDPDVMAGFYIELGPEVTELLPDLLYSTGSPNAGRYLELFSIGLGTALTTTAYTSSTTSYYDELADLRQHFREPTEPGMAWGRLALLQHGDFPPRWLADVVRNSVLDHFEGGEWGHTDYRGPIVAKLGLSEDTLALAFAALANNPSAARIALDEKSGISLDEYVDRVHALDGSIGTGSDITEAFGRALAAGSGSLDVPPDKGRHASSFAFDVILALGEHEETPWGMREPMGVIAAAYAEELLVGAFTLDSRTRESSMDRPEHFDIPPGLDPAFYLSPEAVYRFLHGFGHDDRFSAPFDEAVQDLYEPTVQDALDADLKATADGGRDPRYFEAAMSMFGTLADLQYEAQRAVRGEMDRRDEEFRGLVQQTISDLLTLSRTPRFLTDYGWKFTKMGINRLTKPRSTEGLSVRGGAGA